MSASNRGVSLAVVLVITVAAVGVGAGGAALMLRSRHAPAAVAATHVGTAGAAGAGGAEAMDAMAGMPDMPGMSHGETTSEGVYISPARQQLIGVRTTEVGVVRLTDPVRAVGTLAYDESRITQVHTKIAGWVDRLFVDFVGKPVQKGQALFTLYSPELVSMQREYLLARRAETQLESSQFEETRQGAAALVTASRRRLALWDITDSQIAALELAGEPQKAMTITAVESGIVLERNVYGGQYVTPELAAYRMADLSTIWAIGQVPEADATRVAVGQAVSVEVPSTAGGRPRNGRITFISPDVDPTTRRMRVRVELANPGLALRPDTYVTLTIQTAATSSLAVPAEAVIDAGDRQYVILARADGHFEPRPIHASPPVNGMYPVMHGLVAGDRVVTSAQFLVDSETNLQAAMQAMAGMPGMDMTPTSGK